MHIDDARAFFERATPGYDMVNFGLLDSHGLFSSMANVRLDGFVYTVEGIRAAWRLLNDRGVLTLAFAAGQPWLGGKLYQMVTVATGREPRVYAWGLGWMVMIAEKQPIPNPPAAIRQFAPWRPAHADLVNPVASDDWPYLYLRAKAIPSDYALVILSLLAMSVVAVARLKPRGSGANELHFAAMGTGFLLLETKSIVDSSLYFGTTWIVSLIVIAGVLLMVLLANAVAGWLRSPRAGSMATHRFYSAGVRRAQRSHSRPLVRGADRVDRAGGADPDLLCRSHLLGDVQAHTEPLGCVWR